MKDAFILWFRFQLFDCAAIVVLLLATLIIIATVEYGETWLLKISQLRLKLRIFSLKRSNLVLKRKIDSLKRSDLSAGSVAASGNVK